MVFGTVAIVVAALFAGAAVYINLAEQPARLALEPPALLAQWKRAYPRGFMMQASLVVLSAAFGLLAYLMEDRDWRWFVGAAVIAANWPYTLIVMMPLNNRLKATRLEAADEAVRRQIVRWAGLHMIRTLLGFVAVFVYLWALWDV